MKESPLSLVAPRTPARFSKLSGVLGAIMPAFQSCVIIAFILLFTYQRHRAASLLIMSAAIFVLFALKVASRVLTSASVEIRPRKRVLAIIGEVIYFGLLLLMLAYSTAIRDWLLADGDLKRSKERLEEATRELAAAKSQDERFYALGEAAKESFNTGRIEDARHFAKELLELAPRFKNNWNYGNAVQDGNLVLGRIALREGRLEEAKQYLLTAGGSPGSPTMDISGPNMSLAKDLLEKGERDVVLQYFELCRKFWKMDRGKLKDWSEDAKDGYTPDFGANLVY